MRLRFAEALGTKLKEQKDATFLKQSCNHLECPKPSQPVSNALSRFLTKKGEEELWLRVRFIVVF
jgi:hypothetical protein